MAKVPEESIDDIEIGDPINSETKGDLPKYSKPSEPSETNPDQGQKAPEDKKKGLETRAIIGIVLGVVEAIAIVIILVYFLVIRPRKLREPSDKADNISNTKNENDISTGL